MAFMDSDTPLKHICSNGTTFTADCADLRNGVKYQSIGLTNASDFFEFGAWHASAILSELNGFQGYDCVQFTRVA